MNRNENQEPMLIEDSWQRNAWQKWKIQLKQN